MDEHVADGDDGLPQNWFGLVNRFEQQFAANGYNGAGTSDEVFYRRFGTAPIIFSAPHAIKQIREGEVKEEDRGTGSLAIFLASVTGGTAIAMRGRQTNDPMRADKDHPHKQAIHTDKSEGAQVLIDLHGISAATADDVGCDLGLGLGSIPTAASGFMADAYRQNGRKMWGRELAVKCGFSKFAALKAAGITMFALNQGLSAIQVEHRPSLRFGDDYLARGTAIRLHVNVARMVLSELETLSHLRRRAREFSLEPIKEST